jgi:ABC-type multidrug transport system fused ATPase/permease subunit
MIHTWLKGIGIEKLFRDTEEEEIRKYIPETELDNLNKGWIDGLKIPCWICIFVVPIGIYIELFQSGSQNWIQNTTWLCTMLLNSIASLYVLNKSPRDFKYIIPMNILVYQLWVMYASLSFTQYRMSEYMATNIAHFSLQVLAAPSNWKLNSTAFGITSVYYVYLMIATYGSVPNQLFLGTFVSILFFSGYSFLSNSKIKVLYAAIVKNTKLIEEINKIIQAFPHAVLIQSDSECYTNHEFKKSIKSIDEKIDELESITVQFENNEDINDLKNLLKTHVERLEREEVTEQQSVQLHSLLENDFSDSDEDKSQNDPHYNIKSMKVLWKGKPSYMHVFIDTTNILKLEEANNNIKCQRIMFASTSHEFRTPLNAIINSWKLARSSFTLIKDMIEEDGISFRDSVDFIRYWNKINKFLLIGINSSELLLALVEDVLSLSKIEANIFTIQKSYFDIWEMIDEVTELFRFQCEAKKLELAVEVEKELENYSICSDKLRVKQTLINLVGNAYKFTFKGHIKIQVKRCLLKGQRAIEFIVEDTGVGISEQDKNKLFKLFGMLDKTRAINPNGWGIGLTISKKYIECLQGELHVESVVEEGTIMKFVLPDEALKFESSIDEYIERNNSIPYFKHHNKWTIGRRTHRNRIPKFSKSEERYSLFQTKRMKASTNIFSNGGVMERYNEW